MPVSIDTYALDEAIRSADDNTPLHDLRGTYQALAAALALDARHRFQDLPALAESTQKKRGPGAQPLQDTMALFDSVTSIASGVEYSEFSIGDDGLTFGTSAPGAEEAEYGTIHEQQRQFMADDEDLLRLVDDSGIMDELADRVSRSLGF